MKTAIIIQARMGSTRLPKKIMLEIEGKPMLWHVIERVKHSRESDEIAIATSRETEDDEIIKFLSDMPVAVYRGTMNDVLDRYYNAAKSFGSDVVVRITADCPLIDPSIIDKAITTLKTGRFDYVTNCHSSWMDGFDVECFTFAALEDAWKNAKTASDREHVTPFIRNNPKFKKHFLDIDPRLANVHCSVDKIEDLIFVSSIYRVLLESGKDHTFTFEDVINVLKTHPEFLKINEGHAINEGYAKSLKKDENIR